MFRAALTCIKTMHHDSILRIPDTVKTTDNRYHKPKSANHQAAFMTIYDY
jgi:hypothetical protein